MVNSLACDTVFDSLSNRNQCTDNSCSFISTATLSMDARPGQASCLLFKSPDNSIPDFNVTIVVRDYYHVYPVEYYYTTSDLIYDIDSACACPATGTATCPNCPAHPAYSDYILCNAEAHESSDCVLTHVNGIGSFCTKAGFQIKEHFGILKMKQIFDVQANIDVIVDGVLYPFFYYGTELTTKNFANTLQGTIVSSTARTYVPNYVVFDMVDDNNLALLMDDDTVNSIDSFDYRKIGYIKANQDVKMDPSLSHAININLESCDDNKVSVTNYMIHPHEIMNKNMNRQINVIAPGGFMQGVPFIRNNLPVDTADYYSERFDYGLYAYSNGLPEQAGFVDIGQYVGYPNIRMYESLDFTGVAPFTLNAYDLSTNTFYCVNNTWTYSVTHFDCGDNLNQNCYLVLGTDKTGILRTDPMQKYNQQGFMILTESEYSEKFITNGQYCNNVTSFFVKTFPDSRQHEVKISYEHLEQNFMRLLFNITPNNTMFSSDPLLYMPSSLGDLIFKLDFQNLTVTFVNQNVKPQINSVYVNNTNGYLTVCYQSISVTGDCYLSTNPLFIESTPIQVPINPICSTFPPLTVSSSGEHNVIINCRSYNSSMKVTTDYNLNQNTSEPDNFTETGSSSPNSNLFDFSGLDNLGKLKQALILVAIVVGCVIAALVIVPFFLMFIKYALYPFKFVLNKFRYQKLTDNQRELVRIGT